MAPQSWGLVPPRGQKIVKNFFFDFRFFFLQECHQGRLIQQKNTSAGLISWFLTKKLAFFRIWSIFTFLQLHVATTGKKPASSLKVNSILFFVKLCIIPCYLQVIWDKSENRRLPSEWKKYSPIWFCYVIQNVYCSMAIPTWRLKILKTGESK